MSSHDEEKEVGTSQAQSNRTSIAPSTSDVLQSKSEKKVDDWDGAEDADNPQNWPRSKKIWHTAIPSIIAFICTLGSSIITPGRDSIMQDLGVSAEVALLPYVLYVAGLAFGPMIAAPCSETFGRRAVYLTGMPLFAVFNLGAGFSNNIAALTITRFFAGVFGSPGLSIGGATLTDMWSAQERATPMSLFVTVPFLGPAIGPLVGGFVAEKKGWRWTIWTLLFFTVVGLTPAMFMKETYKAAILKRRAKKRGLTYPTSGRTPRQQALFFVRSTLTRPVHMFCVEPVACLFALYVGINFGMLYGFFAAFPYVFQTIYGFNLGQIGLTFIGLAVGTLVACGLIIIFARLVYRPKAAARKKAGQGPPPPESRLHIGMVGSTLLPVSLFWFGWSAQDGVHWMCPIVAEAFFACGNVMVFMAALSYVMDFYGPSVGASAMGANTLLRYGLGCVFPLFIVQMYSGLGIGWASSLFGFVSLALTPIPWVFYLYGPRLRARSKYVKS
ncbi:Polyamine transporter 4 [Pseudocercospora fuligena]|uniref:Cercosporin MFS transporter CTB4 n=1 Tax=Pseudocercospora fuligena TaxID=685502 RepID=A0A8H6RCG4_9PEZI|nr:Polyamine transporter 4 [Pseudocercospora fuligena]